MRMDYRMNMNQNENKTNAIILGAGMVGSTMAADLSQDDGFTVTIADKRGEALARVSKNHPGVETVKCDLGNPDAITNLVTDYDIVLGALSSVIGFQSLRAVIEAGRNFCDICFMPEDALVLNDLAVEKGVTAVVDNGVAPGMSNMLVGYAETQMDEVEEVGIFVGGLPMERHWPFEYKAGFSPYDVIEEYTRPARMVENGAIVEREALTEAELLDFAGIGTLEAVNTDGLRSLIRTVKARRMYEKTLRYPGHYELMRVLRHMGLFSHDAVAVGAEGVMVRPIDVTSALMFPQWKYEEGEGDLTVMRVMVTGLKDGVRMTYQWDLYDEYDPEAGLSSMSRTTAFPNTIVARMVAGGKYDEPGVHAPEDLGRKHRVLEFVLDELSKRNIIFNATTRIG